MIDALIIPSEIAPFVVLGVVVGMFALFLQEAFPTEVVALLGLAVLLLTGLLPYEGALSVLSNPAPWTIAAMFIVMGGLVRTGALAAFTQMSDRLAARRPSLAVAVLVAFVVLSSAIVSNTPVVVVMIPVFVQLAKTLGVKASKMLIPLSYAAIMGGTLTLIGTSTNLLVDGVAQSGGMEGFGIFEVTPLAAVLVLWGMIYLRFIAPRLLPNKDSLAGLLGGGKKRFFAEVLIPDGSSLIGESALKAPLFKREGLRVVDVVRGDKSLRHNLQEVSFQAGDRVVLRTDVAELLSLQDSKDVVPANAAQSVETETVEVLMTPGCKLVGRRLGDARLRRRYGVYPLAVHRRNQNLGRNFEAVTVRVGDTLLLEGAAEDIARLAQDMDLVQVNAPSAKAYRREKRPVALLVLMALVGLAAVNVAPIFMLAILAVAVLFATRCIDADEAFDLVDGRLLVLIFSMLGVGVALDHTGAVGLIAGALAPFLETMPPFALVLAIYLLTAVLTELVSNNAVAVVVTPVAMGIAAAVGVDPRPLVVAVMIAASASFATPIGYQTNTLVYGPGGYAFTDFIKVGVPLSISMALLTSALIPVFFPF